MNIKYRLLVATECSYQQGLVTLLVGRKIPDAALHFTVHGVHHSFSSETPAPETANRVGEGHHTAAPPVRSNHYCKAV